MPLGKLQKKRTPTVILKNPVFKLVYNFFKKKEQEFLTESEAVVSLTDRGRQVIESWKLPNQSPISVIPCCTDETHFDPAKVDLDRLKALEAYPMETLEHYETLTARVQDAGDGTYVTWLVS